MIAYTFNQVKYVLYHYYELSHGRYPDPETSEKLSIGFPRHARAAFEAACLMAAEVALRVKRCGADGLLVETIFMEPDGLRSEAEVASEYHIIEEYVHRAVNRVTAYCEGMDRRGQEYERWLKENRNKRVVR